MSDYERARIDTAREKILAAIDAPISGDSRQAGITMTALTHAMGEHLLRTVTVMGSADYERDLRRAAEIIVTQAFSWAMTPALTRKLSQ